MTHKMLIRMVTEGLAVLGWCEHAARAVAAGQGWIGDDGYGGYGQLSPVFRGVDG